MRQNHLKNVSHLRGARFNRLVAVVSAVVMTKISAMRNISSSWSAVAIQSAGSPPTPWRLNSVNFHTEGAHQPRRRYADVAEAEDAADGGALIKFAAL